MEEELDEVARGEREWVPLLRAFFGPLKELVDAKRKELRRATSRPSRPTRSAPKATRWSSASGATASSSPAPRTPSTRRRARCPARRPRSSRATAIPARSAARACWPPSAAGSEPSSAARATRTAPTSGRTARRPRTSSRSRWPARRTATGTLVARRARRTGNVFWGCSALPASATSRRTSSRPAPSTTLDEGGRGPVARKGEAGLCLTCGAAVELPDGDPRRAAAARRAGRPGGAGEAGARWRVAARGRARAANRCRRPAHDAVLGRPRPDRGARARANRPAVSPDGRAVTGSEALRRFVRSLEARDASPGDAPLVRGDRRPPTSPGSAAHDADWRDAGPRQALRAYLAELSEGHAKDLRRAAAGGPARVPPLLRPRGAGPGRPVGRHRHAAPAAPPAAGARGGAGRARCSR